MKHSYQQSLIRSGWIIIAVALVVTALLIKIPKVSALGSYNNAEIAETALSPTYLDKDVGVECRGFVGMIVDQVSNGTQNIHTGTSTDYFAQFIPAGGIQITNEDSLTEGDIVQIGQYVGAPGFHTTIIVSHNGGDNFTVVDSNYTTPDTVREHGMTINLNSTTVPTKAYQMGTVEEGSSSSSSPSAASSSSGSNSSGNDTVLNNTSSHLRQFYVSNGKWTAFDASAATGVSVSGDPAVDSSGTFIRDTNGHLRQFYVNGGNWTSFDVSAATGTAIAALRAET
jgi:hypothetical protein